MRLIKLVLDSYRRFAERTGLDTDDQLIAIVGPNEAGKSSLLAACHLLNDGEPMPARDRTLGADRAAKLVATFVLETDDRAALEGIPGCETVRRLTLTKSEDGSRTYDVSPRPTRDRDLRINGQAAWSEVADSIPPDSVLNPDAVVASFADQLAALVAGDAEHATPAQLEGLAGLEAAIAAAGNETEDEDDQKSLAAAAVAIARLMASEQAVHPRNQAIQALAPRVPRFAEFGPEDRLIESRYSIDALLDAPKGLGNLAHLAGLDLAALHAELTTGLAAESYGRLQDARDRLEAAFPKEIWRQADLSVAMHHVPDTLSVVIKNRSDSKFANYHERSDGLRAFVALRAFLDRESKGEPTILLIDEAEQHLHYDGQADLIEVLTTQELASQVIYTTHSAGCLPPDLGRGVRAVVPDPDPATAKSTIETGFWGEGPGCSRLLFGMGASLLAFTVPRRLLISEGATEAILLPTLLREANGLPTLGYQVAPGIANTDPADIPQLATYGGRCVYVVDGDDDGKTYEGRLVRAGVPPEHVFNLGALSGIEDLNIEELVAQGVYVEAVNDALAEHYEGRVLPPDRLGDAKWAKAVEAWCEEQDISFPSKRVVAQRIVDVARQQARDSDSGKVNESQVVNPDHATVLSKIHERAMAAFPTDKP